MNTPIASSKKDVGADAAAVVTAEQGSTTPATARHTDEQVATVGYLQAAPANPRGEFYVARKRGSHGLDCEYLHEDGVWRSMATRIENGVVVKGGWFSTRQAAEAALRAAKGSK